MDKCIVYELGLIEYQQAWDLQNRLAAEIAAGEHPPALFLLEHPHVYTFGSSGEQANLLWDQAEQERRAAAVHWVDRGGDVTYHGPGQLVGYPLLPLSTGRVEVDPQSGKARLPGGDYVGYLRKLEKVLIKTLFAFQIGGGQILGQTGVWVQGDVPSRCTHCPPDLFESPAKIASIGVKIDAAGISRHGFALNVDPDMSYFDGIVACGLENQNKCSLAYFLEPVPTVEEVSAVLVPFFGEVFGYPMESGKLNL